MRRNAVGVGENDEGRNSVTPAPALALTSASGLPRELGLVGHTSAGRVLFLAGHLDF